jgi:plasmid stability protein
MADIKIRNLDDRIVYALRARARQNGTSLEEEARVALASVVADRRRALVKRLAAFRATLGPPPSDPSLDSVAIIRSERDAWG